MLKKLTKIFGLLLVALLAAGIIFSASCSYYSFRGLDYEDGVGEVSSQGGFLVEKGDYVYFVNGDASYTESNKYGRPVRGSLMRISKADIAARNYTNADTVVPLLMYSGSKDAGLFIYGDYVYYTTPGTERNSDGEVLNSRLDFKRSKLDGTETMKGRYLQLESNTDEYRYVQVDGVVYILYVVVGEQLYDDMDATATNIHSFNTETEEDTVLAYDVDSYMFDDEDVTNPRIYYTMSVKNYYADSTYSYNQVYTVTADAVEDEENPRYEGLENITGWITEDKAKEDDDDGIDEWDVYINLGDMVFDGIGRMDVVDPDEDMTMFNWGYQFKDEKNEDWWYDYCNELRLNYVLSKYTNGTLFYLCDTDNTSNYLFKADESDILSDGWDPIKDNPETKDRILANGSDAAYNYMFLFDDDGEFTGVIEAGSSNINVNYIGTDGKLGTKLQASSSTDSAASNEGEGEGSRYYTIAKDTVATLLFTETDTIKVGDDVKTVDYLYYSSSGGNGVGIYRVCYTGFWEDYHEMPIHVDDEDEFTPTQIFDVDAESDWYTPEMVDNQLIFAADSDDMASYNYLMIADLRHVEEDGSASEYMMGNKELTDLNDKLDDIAESIEDYLDEEGDYASKADTYANLGNAIWFAYYTGDSEYIYDLADMCNEAAYEDDETVGLESVYSGATLKIYQDFIDCTGDVWSDYADNYKYINGTEEENKVYSNRRDYYYTLFGVMDDDEADDYMDGLKSSWLQAEPEYTWWEGLSTAAKAWFIVGMCLIGLVVVAAAVLIPVLLVRRSGKRKGVVGRQKIAVSLAVDEGVDVYSESLKEPESEAGEDEPQPEAEAPEAEQSFDEPQEASEDEENRGDE